MGFGVTPGRKRYLTKGLHDRLYDPKTAKYRH